MEIRFTAPELAAIDELKAEALALPLFEDERPLRGALGLLDWRLCGQVSRVILRGHVSGERAQTLLVPTRGRLPFDKLFVVGAGARAALDERSFGVVVERMLEVLDGARVRVSAIGLPGRRLDAIDPQRAMQLFLAYAGRHPEQDEVTLLESSEAAKKMAPVVERERRRERADFI